MSSFFTRIANAPVSLPTKLRLLRLASYKEWGKSEGLKNCASTHPEITRAAQWFPRAWWGVAAGELIYSYLYNASQQHLALKLVTHVDTAALEHAQLQGKGVIIATAHLGPPKFLMSWLLQQQLPLYIWSNTNGMPTWLTEGGSAAFFNPLDGNQRSLLLAKSALHLRRGGVLLAAADFNSGDRLIALQRMGYKQYFSLGLPTLARRVGSPVVTALALWHRNGVRIKCKPLEPPDSRLSDDDWNRAWLERYWDMAEIVLKSSPENLRFLRQFVKVTH